MPSKFMFGRISDSDVLRFVDALMDLFEQSSVSVSIGDSQVISATANEEHPYDKDNRGAFSEILSNNSFLITNMMWRTPNDRYMVVYYRGKHIGKNNNGAEAWTTSPTPFIDGLEVRCEDQHAPLVLRTVASYVEMAPPIIASPEAGTAMEQSQAILNRISSAIATLVEHTTERQKDLDATRAGLSLEMDKVIEARQEGFDASMEAIKEKYAEKEHALTQRESELDDRANTT